MERFTGVTFCGFNSRKFSRKTFTVPYIKNTLTTLLLFKAYIYKYMFMKNFVVATLETVKTAKVYSPANLSTFVVASKVTI